jgi:hypothetical protein
MAHDWRPIAPDERALVEALLAEAFFGRDGLRAQVEGAEARTIDSDGSFALKVIGAAVRVLERVPVTGSTRDAEGIGVEVLLHVVDGVMSEVEIYRIDGKPVIGAVDPSALTLTTLLVVG